MANDRTLDALNGQYANIGHQEHLDFLDYTQAPSSPDFSDELVIQKRELPQQAAVKQTEEDPEHLVIKVEEEETELEKPFSDNHYREGDSDSDNADIEELLIPEVAEPPSRVLRNCTIKVKPVKYTHLTVEPKTFKMAISGKFPSLLTLLVLAIDLQLPVKQFDVKSAFLFAPLEKEIYIKTPKGSNRKAPYLRLVKSLYGLKQAPKNWYETLTLWFEEIEYAPSVSDACLFIHKNKDSFIFFHVDDLTVVGKPDEFEQLFLKRFPNSTAHSPDTLLGMNLIMAEDHVELSKPALIDKGLQLLELEDCKPVKTPLTPAVQLKKATKEDHQAFLKLNINYRLYTGMLNYLACRTLPNLAAAVSILSRFNQRPGLSHWKEVLHCWKYLKGTRHFGLLLQPCADTIGEHIQFYTNATWAEDQETQLSQSGTITFWKSCPILWNSKKQKNITMSSTESKMNALSDGEQENQWLAFLIKELWKRNLPPTVFHIDNKGLLEKLNNFGSNSKTKHLDIKIKSLCKKFKNNSIDVVGLLVGQMFIYLVKIRLGEKNCVTRLKG
ncbi:hypothetical protein PCASD_21365 [Puccinia coronata f. sp. avenae]|uniref:Reverse transcriptase Ty1/copia-type domain-containing protein n=1 Tax=Puccinia coronata f. sp. avenae TaxID=200324 RepID=A0A2N5ST31_9BASI|nr:hypothetical protein PCASD_21365 [Puccinia coronata f. sp. avenae]